MQKNVLGLKNPPRRVEIRDLHIRNFRFEDIDTISEIEQASYPDPWSRKMFERELELNFSHFFVGTVLSRIVAYAVFWQVVDESHLTNITVSEEYRRNGLGKKMLKYIIDFAKYLKTKKMVLEVRENNMPAVTFYRKFGFRKIGSRKKYYSSADDAIIMEKIL